MKQTFLFNKKIHLLTFASFCLLLLNGCVSQSSHLKVADEAKQFKKVAERQKKSIEKLETELADAKAKKEEAEKVAERQKKSIEKLETELADAKAKKTEAEDVSEQRKKTIENLEDEIAEREKNAEDIKEKLIDSKRELEIKEQLITSLKGEIREGKIEVTKLTGQTNIRLKDAILFESGKAELKPDGIKIIKKIGEQLKTIKDRQILVEGHTDNVRIRAGRKSVYSSNLELSAARSISVINVIKKWEYQKNEWCPWAMDITDPSPTTEPLKDEKQTDESPLSWLSSMIFGIIRRNRWSYPRKLSRNKIFFIV